MKRKGIGAPNRPESFAPSDSIPRYQTLKDEFLGFERQAREVHGGEREKEREGERNLGMGKKGEGPRERGR